MSTKEVAPPAGSGRMPASERRLLILESAREVFGKRGYYGATTDQIAAAAGVSQPYVVRMFGSKESLFLEVLDDALQTLLEAFRTALAAAEARGASPDERRYAVGAAFIDLATTRGLHTVLLQAFVSGEEPAIGAAARAGFLEIYRFLVHEAGANDDEINRFLGSGMLFGVLLGIRMPDVFGADPDATALMQATFGEKCMLVVDAARS
ncbi:TetR/AcrR family transcriptional regulator [Curtobacterium ammoniigenes]|uniref:TetR/AcrR family transcriptional regulator n=1 Tax=Curtobacterium ammoniigenes TaxID=395387 RepID=UPI00082D552A|nr:TetR/AcrR family transcriptional regulator [Curtobacterium ammoniigenes]